LPIGGRLAFASTRDGSLSIYVADESGVKRLASGYQPAWSPDGFQIAFNGAADEGTFVMNADGTGVRFLGRGFNPDWSPDGQRIVFNDEGSGIFVMNADGSAIGRLIGSGRVKTPRGFDCRLYWPAWSPDGQHIAFVCASYDDIWQIHLMNPDGSNARPLSTECCSTQAEPAWSSDSLRIAFNGVHRNFDNLNIDVINVDGSGLRSPAVPDGFSPDWSKDGRLAFTRTTGPGPTLLGGFETRIFVATEGGDARQIVPDAVNPERSLYGDSDPDWAP
jgi:Tol biopolymer transport system component